MRVPLPTLTLATVLAVAALAGGAVALGGAALLGVVLDGDDPQSPMYVRDFDSGFQASGPPDFRQASPNREPGPLTIREIYRRAAPGVVQVTSTTLSEEQIDPLFGFPLPQQERKAQGSGFVIDESGYIVTNYHVVAGASDIEVSFSNRESLRARTVGSDQATDIALLKVDADARAFHPLELGNSDQVRVGDAVVAIGNPFGLERSVTAGIVSALQRTIESPDESPIDRVIQTDASINQGNSGGPLLNAAGQVIGVNTQIATGSSSEAGNAGIGFAVPINTVRAVVSQLETKGRVDHAELGIDVQQLTQEIADLFHMPTQEGLLVTRVQDGTGAAKAGLRAGETQVVVSGESWLLGGDIVVSADGKKLATRSDLLRALAAKKPGERIKLQLYRGEDSRTVTVELSRRN
jgi:S1-C subfamily serine protease